jgi:hypothetical protein
VSKVMLSSLFSLIRTGIIVKHQTAQENEAN